MRSIDPARMTNEAIMAELGELLATGFERRITSSMRPALEDKEEQKELDVFTDDLAQCGKSKRKSKCQSQPKSQS